MGIKEFQESFRKKYRNEDLYLLFDRKGGTSISSRLRQNKSYCRVVIKNKLGDKLKFINGGKVVYITNRYMSDFREYEIIYCGTEPFRLVPLKLLKISQREQKLCFDFFAGGGESVPNDLWRFCDIACLFGKYTAEGSLESDVLERKENCKVLSERQIIRVEKFLNETIHSNLKQKLQIEKEEKIKLQQREIQKSKKQKLEETLDKERDF